MVHHAPLLLPSPPPALPPTEGELARARWDHAGGQPPSAWRGAAPLSEIRRQLAALLEGRILVGHHLRKDLAALGLAHPEAATRDTLQFRWEGGAGEGWGGGRVRGVGGRMRGSGADRAKAASGQQMQHCASNTYILCHGCARPPAAGRCRGGGARGASSATCPPKSWAGASSAAASGTAPCVRGGMLDGRGARRAGRAVHGWSLGWEAALWMRGCLLPCCPHPPAQLRLLPHAGRMPRRPWTFMCSTLCSIPETGPMRIWWSWSLQPSWPAPAAVWTRAPRAAAWADEGTAGAGTDG